jgi:hypothetical protein
MTCPTSLVWWTNLYLHLHRACWSIGNIAAMTPQGLDWLVWGNNGENLIRAEGRTRDEAWQNAEMQAMGLRMLVE